MKKFFTFLFIFFCSILFILFYSINIFPEIHFGQRFILTLPRTTDRTVLAEWLNDTKPAGVMILWPEHFQKREETQNLIDFLQKKAEEIKIPKLFVAVDWEGGIVSRAKENGGFISIPAPRNLSFIDKKYSELSGRLVGQQLRSVGINVNFAPCLDLFNRDNQILATRCFSDDPEKIFKYAYAFAKGLIHEGVLPVFKHFPGIGGGSADTHFDSTNVVFSESDIYPFKKVLESDCLFLMLSHALCDKFGRQPVSRSKMAIDWIKNNTNKDFLLISDDFCMAAANGEDNLKDVVLKTLKAGCDLLILTDLSGGIRVQKNLFADLSESDFTDDEKVKFEKSVKRINEAKSVYLQDLTEHFSDKELLNEKETSALLAEKTIYSNVSNLGGVEIDKDLLLITFDLTKIRTLDKWLIENGSSYLFKKLVDKEFNVREILIDPNVESNIESVIPLLSKIEGYENVIIQTFFYANQDWNKIQKRWLKIFEPHREKLIIVSLGHPLEEQLLPEATVFNLGSYLNPMIDALVKRFDIKN